MQFGKFINEILHLNFNGEFGALKGWMIIFNNFQNVDSLKTIFAKYFQKILQQK